MGKALIYLAIYLHVDAHNLVAMQSIRYVCVFGCKNIIDCIRSEIQ